MDKIVNYVIGALVVMLLAAVLLPIGLTAMHDANTTGWTSSETTLFSIIGVMILVGVVVGVIYMATKNK
jgi:hypothetical protein